MWVPPDRRGEGIGVRGMAAVVELVRADIAPVVSLYVNEFNLPARRGVRAGRLPADGHVRDDDVLIHDRRSRHARNWFADAVRDPQVAFAP